MRHASPILATVVAWSLAATALAQSGYQSFTSTEHGFRLRVPRFTVQQPLEPMEEQILAKFQGRHSAELEGKTRELELILLVVRIAKAEGPTTGAPEQDARQDAEEEKEGEAGEAESDQPVDEKDLVSLKDQRRAWLNGGRNLEEFLKRREWVHQKRLAIALSRPPKSKDGRTYDVYEVSSNRSAGLVVRAFTLDDGIEIFGLVALGAVEAFHPQVLTAVKSLERFAAGSSPAAEAGEAYEGSELRDPDRRAAVRGRLPEGWEAHDTEDFILVTNVRNKKLIRDMLADLQIMRAAYLERFPPIAPLEQVSTVRVCASYDDYLRYGANDGTAGYFNPLDEELVLFDPGKRIPKVREWLKEVSPAAVLYHEAMHQYLHYANGQVPPASWFGEGYGEVFGSAKISRSRGEVTKIDKNGFRMAWIKTSQRQRAWPDLGILLKMTQAEFYGSSALQNYAMAWAFCHFLELERAKAPGARNESWASIPDTYLANLRKATEKHVAEMPEDAPKDWLTAFADEIQAEAHEKTFGAMDLAELERAWIDAMRKY